MLTSLPAFVEHSAGLVWQRDIGSDVDVAIPQLSIALGGSVACSLLAKRCRHLANVP